MWGGLYSDVPTAGFSELAAFAEVSLRTGLMRLRSDPSCDEVRISSMVHKLAGVLLHRRRYTEAEKEARSALAVRSRVIGVSSMAAAESRALLSRVLAAQENHDQASAEARAALLAIEQCGENSPLLQASLNALLGRTEFASGRDGGPFLRAALKEQLRRLECSDPELLGTLEVLARMCDRWPTSESIGELQQIWQPDARGIIAAIREDIAALNLRATSAGAPQRSGAIERLIKLQQLLGEERPSVGLLMAQSNAESSEGRHLEAARTAMRAADVLSSEFGGESFQVLACLSLASTERLYGGDAAGAVALGRRGCAILDAVPEAARDPLFAANTHRYLAWYLTVAEEFEAAAPVWRTAIEKIRSAVGPDHYLVPFGEAGLALCEAELGRLPEADALSEQAVRAAEHATAIPIDQLSSIFLVRGHVLLKQARHADARASLEKAWELFFSTYPPAYAWRQLLLTDMIAACRAVEDAEAEKIWRSRLEDR